MTFTRKLKTRKFIEFAIFELTILCCRNYAKRGEQSARFPLRAHLHNIPSQLVSKQLTNRGGSYRGRPAITQIKS